MDEVKLVTDVNAYIESTLSRIHSAKQRCGKLIVDFSVKFQNDRMRDNFNIFFANLKYNVEMRKCPRGNYDIIISWRNE